MAASLYVPSTVTTASKKQSIISHNKPNCGAAKTDEKTVVDAQPDSKENIDTNLPLNQNDENELKMPKREITPDIISMQKPEDEMKPQVMEEDVKPLKDQFETKHNETENVIDDTTAAANDTLNEETNGETTNDDDDKKGDLKEDSSHAHTPAKKIITSEEEAKARFAEKRREMKEKMEREAELERMKQVLSSVNIFNIKI